jgi:hypothetical protein
MAVALFMICGIKDKVSEVVIIAEDRTQDLLNPS